MSLRYEDNRFFHNEIVQTLRTLLEFQHSQREQPLGIYGPSSEIIASLACCGTIIGKMPIYEFRFSWRNFGLRKANMCVLLGMLNGMREQKQE